MSEVETRQIYKTPEKGAFAVCDAKSFDKLKDQNTKIHVYLIKVRISDPNFNK